MLTTSLHLKSAILHCKCRPPLCKY
jgi:hypothetical protein